MTQEEVTAIAEKIETAAANLTEYGEDVLVMMLVVHEPDADHPHQTRQMLFSGRGNWWARLGMAHDYLRRMGIEEDQANAS